LSTAPIRLVGLELEQLRIDCWNRDGRRCVICLRPVRLKAGSFDSLHMAHVKGRGAGGPDVLENVVAKCMDCHSGLEHNPKSVPKKVR
jgi:5-methylcytosine-specific restriction endonuclease McrA